MKKVVGILLLAVTVASVQAALIERTWSSQGIYAYAYFQGGLPPPPEPILLPLENYDGAGWRIDIDLAGSHPADPLIANASAVSSYGWYVGYGFWIDEFNFTAFEGEAVVMRIYNAADTSDATYWSDSLPIVLPDLEGDPPPEALELTFEFIPEPSSIAMIGLGAGVLYLGARRLRYKER